MPSTATIPRFLLPRGDALLQYTRTSAFRNGRFLVPVRHASTTKPIPKPLPKTLAKPEKFNPPSHPSRLVKPNPIRQYGPRLTEDDKKVHQTKQYPHSAPPKGSLMDRFLNNRQIHMWIALSVLSFFALWTLKLGWQATSPYAGTMPSLSDWFWHPLDSLSRAGNTIKLSALQESEQAAQSRARAINETMKTKAYRVMHGLEPLHGQPTEVQILVARMKGEYVEGNGEETPVVPKEPREKRPIKKWLGIWS